MVNTGAYLDHASAPVLDARVRDAMAPFVEQLVGSPSGVHEWARSPADAIDEARRSVAQLVDAPPESIIFTSGPTEARNLAVKGLLSANPRLGEGVVTTAVDHPATIAACRTVTRDAGELTIVGVDAEARVSPHDLAAAVRPDTAVVAVVHGQAEVGTIEEVANLVAAAKTAHEEALLVVDAEQTAGVLPIHVAEMDCDALVLGGAPMGAPPWAGALYVKPGTRLHPLIEGGLQEHGKRGGAEDLPAIAALGEAARIARVEAPARARSMRDLRDRLLAKLLAVPDVRQNGPSGDGRLPGNVHVSVSGVEAEALVLALATRDVAAAPGSACSAAGKASPVLEAMGVEPPWVHGAVLFTLGPSSTAEDVDRGATAFGECVERLRAMSPLGQ